MITAIIPAFNEADRIEEVLIETKKYVDEIIVIDDCSSDDTALVSKKYAKVFKNSKNKGYIYSIKKGFKKAKYDIIVTLDADGEHDPADIPRLVKPIIDDKADLVQGARDFVPRFSERLINRLTNYKVKVRDCGTGFHALKKDLALKLKLKGVCICGIFVLEAHFHDARISEVGVKTNIVNKKRKIAFKHLIQFFLVLYFIVFKL